MTRERTERIEIQVHHEGDAIVITPLARRLGSKEFSLLVKEYTDILKKRRERIIVDFRLVERFSFAGCAFLVQMKQLAMQAGREFAVRNRLPRLKAEMSLYRLNGVIDGETRIGA